MSSSKSPIELDDKDKFILKYLQDHANASLREIEEEFTKNGQKFSTTGIRSRLQRLKESNIIKKTITLIDCRQLGYKEMILASLRVNTNHTLDALKKKLDGMEEIKYAYIVTGEYPLFIMAKCLDHEDSMNLIENLRNLPGVEEIKTQIVLDRIKEDPTIIIPK